MGKGSTDDAKHRIPLAIIVCGAAADALVCQDEWEHVRTAGETATRRRRS